MELWLPAPSLVGSQGQVGRRTRPTSGKYQAAPDVPGPGARAAGGGGEPKSSVCRRLGGAWARAELGASRSWFSSSDQA